MKSLYISLLFVLSFSFANVVNAQSKQEVLNVAGNCGMCKKKIETAAKSAGATYAVWNEDSKKLTVKYNAGNLNVADIQKSIAAAGYDTQAFKATAEAYDNLHDCCKYDRATTTAQKCCDAVACCKDGSCTKMADCTKDKNCCANAVAEKCAAGSNASCCKKG